MVVYSQKERKSAVPLLFGYLLEVLYLGHCSQEPILRGGTLSCRRWKDTDAP